MFCRNIDFYALLFIVFGLVAFSKAPAFVSPPVSRSIRFQSAIGRGDCPVSTEVLSRLRLILHR